MIRSQLDPPCNLIIWRSWRFQYAPGGFELYGRVIEWPSQQQRRIVWQVMLLSVNSYSEIGNSPMVSLVLPFSHVTLRQRWMLLSTNLIIFRGVWKMPVKRRLLRHSAYKLKNRLLRRKRLTLANRTLRSKTSTFAGRDKLQRGQRREAPLLYCIACPPYMPVRTPHVILSAYDVILADGDRSDSTIVGSGSYLECRPATARC